MAIILPQKGVTRTLKAACPDTTTLRSLALKHANGFRCQSNSSRLAAPPDDCRYPSGNLADVQLGPNVLLVLACFSDMSQVSDTAGGPPRQCRACEKCRCPSSAFHLRLQLEGCTQPQLTQDAPQDHILPLRPPNSISVFVV